MNKGEVWFVEFPLEEEPTRTLNRPVIVLDENILGVLSVKITKHKARKTDPYDTPIVYWEEAKLKLASTARVSKVLFLSFIILKAMTIITIQVINIIPIPIN